ncbi:MAG: hypothetical protein ISQ34_02205 [Rickettsiales bacterium]|nr:hypothetical protein [Rickettsiales bacterium]
MANSLTGSFLEILVSKTLVVFISTTFSILLIMLTLNIITVDEVIDIFNMSPEAANAFRTVVSRIQEVTHNILDIVSQLFNKIFSWAGVEADFNDIKVDVNKGSTTTVEPPKPPLYGNPGK